MNGLKVPSRVKEKYGGKNTVMCAGFGVACQVSIFLPVCYLANWLSLSSRVPPIPLLLLFPWSEKSGIPVDCCNPAISFCVAKSTAKAKINISCEEGNHKTKHRQRE